MVAAIQVETAVSQLEKQWLEDFLSILMMFLVSMNLIFICPFVIEAP
jgi:hypothetical protein